MFSGRKLSLSLITAVALAAAVSALPGSARATPITYTFTGVGTGDVGTTAFSGAFTFTFSGNTTSITSGGGEFRQDGIGGTFSEGAFNGTLLSNNAVIVNTDPLFPRLSFFNSTFDNGGTLQNSVFSSYALATALGPITVTTGPNLLPTLNAIGDGFGTTGGGPVIELLSISSLSFSATVPEPTSLAMFGAALFLLGLVGWRKKTS